MKLVEKRYYRKGYNYNCYIAITKIKNNDPEYYFCNNAGTKEITKKEAHTIIKGWRKDNHLCGIGKTIYYGGWDFKEYFKPF